MNSILKRKNWPELNTRDEGSEEEFEDPNHMFKNTAIEGPKYQKEHKK